MRAERWPPLPYKGLSYYGPDDAPLFAGREADVIRCAYGLARDSTRILILHGSTGCGKSSFLRGGLIPSLEEEGFQVPKEQGQQGAEQGSRTHPLERDKEKRGKALLIVSTNRPLARLAETVYNFASVDLTIETLFGPRSLKLPEVLADYANRQKLVEAVEEKPEELVQLLGRLSRKIPRTLVLIVDQGEEMLTSTPGEAGDLSRKQFYEFMAHFSQSEYNLKLLVALRTEYHGKFYAQIVRGELETVGISTFFLDELTKEQLIQAIKRPTLKEYVAPFGKPYEHYKFSYQEGLPEMIAADLIEEKVKGIEGGILPVMQVVCGRLYEKTEIAAPPDPHRMITKADYLSLGGITGQMNAYLEGVLLELCHEANLPGRSVPFETERWKDVLSELCRRQVDGTVVKELKGEKDLETLAGNLKCNVPFDVAMRFLSGDEKRVLRSVEVIPVGTSTHIRCYTLGHDAIGLVLKDWKIAREEREAYEARARRTWLWAGTVVAAVGTLAALLLPRWLRGVGFAFAGYGIFFILNSFVPSWLFRPFEDWSLIYLLAISNRATRRRLMETPRVRAALARHPPFRVRFERMLARDSLQPD